MAHGGQAGNPRGPAHQVDHGVDVVRQDVAHHAGQGRGALFGVVDVIHHVARHDLAEIAPLDQCSGPGDAVLVDHVVPRHANHATALGRGFHLHDVLGSRRQRLLHQDVFARLQGQLCVLQMRVEVREHEDGVDLRVGDEVFRRLVEPAPPLLRSLKPALPGAIPRAHQARVGQLLERPAVKDRDLTGSDETDANRFG